MTTEARLKSHFPDLEFVKLPAAEDHPLFNYNGFKPSSTTIPAGHVIMPGKKPFPIDVLYERDYSVPMRDSAHIYTDVFRPTDSDTFKVPAIIAWSPYGKTGTGPQQYDKMGPYRSGVALEQTSGYEKFEGPDPAYWCKKGYAIVNVDARGAGKSEGNIYYWGQQEAEDVHDTIDWISRQGWCNGSVAMMGNSWLAIAQINYASRHMHPALKALAPMESAVDPYIDLLARGGFPKGFKLHDMVLRGFAGPNGAENMPKMIFKRPLYDDYWEAKKIHTENLNVPLYLLASYSSALHSRGSFHTYRTAKTLKKWLRVHPHQEWHDLYSPETLEDLIRYFDCYCKGIDNGWERTPPIRLSILGFNESSAKTIVNRTEQEYPLARQQFETLYLDSTKMQLSKSKPPQASSSHEGHSLTASSDFTFHFSEPTELVGYPMVCLWMSCADKDDFDVGVQIRKISKTGKLLEHLNYPCPVGVEQVPDVNVAKTLGPQGFLRASHVVSKDESLSTETEMIYRHDTQKPVPKGHVVKLDITFWPIGMVFAAGEGIMLRVSGHDQAYPETELFALTEPEDTNIGDHTIHTGGEHASYLIIPKIPQTKA